MRVFLILLLFQVISTSPTFIEQRDAEVLRLCERCSNHGWCNGTLCKCLEPFKGVHCEIQRDFCVDELTGQRKCVSGICEPRVGGFYCRCPPNKFGYLCDKEMPRNYSGAIASFRAESPKSRFFYNPEPEVGAVTLFYLVIPYNGKRVDKKFLAKFDTGDGLAFDVTHDLFKNIPSMAAFVDKEWNKLGLLAASIAELRSFGGANLFIFPYIFSLESQYTVTMELFNGDVSEFKADYPVKTRTRENTCTPAIELLDCGRNSRWAPKWKRSVHSTIRSTISRTCPSSELTREWTVYDLRSMYVWRPYPWIVTLPGDSLKNFHVKIWNHRHMTFEPFSHHVGLYAVQLKVTEKLKDTRKMKPGTNSAFCYFEVKTQAMVADIIGGADKVVSSLNSIVMNGSQSRDPNEPKGSKGTATFAWSCKVEQGEDSPGPCKGIDVVISQDEIFKVPANVLAPKTSYEFKLEVGSSKPAYQYGRPSQGYARQTVRIVKVRTAQIDIRCVKNCRKYTVNFDDETWTIGLSNPDSPIYLQTICVEPFDLCKRITYKWSIEPRSDLPVSKPTKVLIIKEDTIPENTEARVIVEGRDENDLVRGTSAFIIRGNARPKVTSDPCKVEPSSGTVEDLFTVTCTGFTDDDPTWPLDFSFYQKNTHDVADEAESPGVQMEYETVPATVDGVWTVKVSNLKLMQGDGLTVMARDKMGLSVSVKVPITVSEPAGGWSLDKVKELFDGDEKSGNISQLINSGDASRAVRLINTLTDGLEQLSDAGDPEVANKKAKMRVQFAEILGMVALPSGNSVTQVATSLRLLLNVNTEPTERRLARSSGAVVLTLSEALLRVGDEDYELAPMSSREVTKLARTILQSASRLVTGTPAPPVEVTIETEQDVEYPYYEFLDVEYVDTLNDYDHAARQVMTAVEVLGMCLAGRQKENLNEVTIASTPISLWVKIDSPLDLAGRLLGAQPDAPLTGLQIDNELAGKLSENIGAVDLEISTFTKNILWFKPRSADVNSEMVGVRMMPFISQWTFYVKQPPIKQLPAPIDIFLAVPPDAGNTVTSEPSVSGSVGGDVDIGVHRVIADEGSVLFVQFEEGSTPNPLQVVITRGFRPTMEDFDHASVVSSTAGWIVRSAEAAESNDTWFYVGVQAADSPKSGNTITYAFRTYTIKCSYWDDDANRWAADGCHLEDDSNLERLHCRCVHLSIFSGSVLILPNTVDPVMDVNLFFELTYRNPWIVVLVLIVLLLYLIGLIWARRRDRRDRQEHAVSVLNDNRAEDSRRYLITVYTGHRINSGTSSKIGIELTGTLSRSGPHILSDPNPKRPILQSGSECTFLMLTEGDLGDLTTLHLWSNNSGRRTSWYCDKVVVVDVETDRAWIFLVEQWLSVLQGKGTVYCQVPPATEKDTNGRRQVIQAKLSKGFRDTHIWCSIFLRHPLTNFTRSQRLTVACTVLFMTMLVQIMFYGIPSDDPDTQLEVGTVTLDLRGFIIALESLLITIPPTLFIVFLFRNSRPSRDWEMLAHTTRERKADLDKPLPPPNAKYRFPHWSSYVAWTLCLTIIAVCAYFVILYGLSYGQTVSFCWMITMTVSVVQSIIILQPLKLIALAIFFTYVSLQCKKKLPPPEYDARQLEQAERQRAQIELKTPEEVSHMRRTQKMYRPLPRKQVREMKESEYFRERLEKMLVDLAMFVIFLMTLYYVVWSNQDPMAYLSTQNMRRLVVEGTYTEGPSLKNVRTMAEFVRYLNLTLIPALHTEHWYNGDPVNETGWAADKTTRLLGIVRLRQLRVASQPCAILPQVLKFEEECNLAYSSLTAETRDFSVGWTPDLEDFRDTADRGRMPWRYDSNTGSVALMGEFFFYPDSGYVALLGRTCANSRSVLNFLAAKDWLDERTRVVFIEFSTYNVNLNLFNVVTLVCERDASGLWVISDKIATVKLLIVRREVSLATTVAFFVCVIILALHFAHQIYLFKGNMRSRIFISAWTVIDLIIIALCVACAVIYTVRSSFVETLIAELHAAEWSEYVSFHEAAYWEIVLRYLFAFLIALSTARLWKLLHLGETFRHLQNTLSIAARSLCTLTVIVATMLAVFTLIALLLFSSFKWQYRDVWHSVVNLFVFMTCIFGESVEIVMDINDTVPLVGPLFFLIFGAISFVYLLNMFVIVVKYNYYALRPTRKIHSEGPLDFLYRVVRKKIKQRKRLRGGADSMALIAVPKHERVVNSNAVDMATDELAAMRNIVEDYARSNAGGEIRDGRTPSEERLAAMAVITLRAAHDAGIARQPKEKFYKGVDDDGQRFVLAKRIQDAEETVNMFTNPNQQDDDAQDNADLIEETDYEVLKAKLDYLTKLLEETEPVLDRALEESSPKVSEESQPVDGTPDESLPSDASPASKDLETRVDQEPVQQENIAERTNLSPRSGEGTESTGTVQRSPILYEEPGLMYHENCVDRRNRSSCSRRAKESIKHGNEEMLPQPDDETEKSHHKNCVDRRNLLLGTRLVKELNTYGNEERLQNFDGETGQKNHENCVDRRNRSRLVRGSNARGTEERLPHSNDETGQKHHENCVDRRNRSPRSRKGTNRYRLQRSPSLHEGRLFTEPIFLDRCVDPKARPTRLYNDGGQLIPCGESGRQNPFEGPTTCRFKRDRGQIVATSAFTATPMIPTPYLEVDHPVKDPRSRATTKNIQNSDTPDKRTVLPKNLSRQQDWKDSSRSRHDPPIEFIDNSEELPQNTLDEERYIQRAQASTDIPKSLRVLPMGMSHSQGFTDIPHQRPILAQGLPRDHGFTDIPHRRPIMSEGLPRDQGFTDILHRCPEVAEQLSGNQQVASIPHRRYVLAKELPRDQGFTNIPHQRPIIAEDLPRDQGFTNILHRRPVISEELSGDQDFTNTPHRRYVIAKGLSRDQGFIDIPRHRPIAAKDHACDEDSFNILNKRKVKAEKLLREQGLDDIPNRRLVVKEKLSQDQETTNIPHQRPIFAEDLPRDRGFTDILYRRVEVDKELSGDQNYTNTPHCRYVIAKDLPRDQGFIDIPHQRPLEAKNLTHDQGPKDLTRNVETEEHPRDEGLIDIPSSSPVVAEKLLQDLETTNISHQRTIVEKDLPRDQGFTDIPHSRPIVAEDLPRDQGFTDIPHRRPIVAEDLPRDQGFTDIPHRPPIVAEDLPRDQGFTDIPHRRPIVAEDLPRDQGFTDIPHRRPIVAEDLPRDQGFTDIPHRRPIVAEDLPRDQGFTDIPHRRPIVAEDLPRDQGFTDIPYRRPIVAEDLPRDQGFTDIPHRRPIVAEDLPRDQGFTDIPHRRPIVAEDLPRDQGFTDIPHRRPIVAEDLPRDQGFTDIPHRRPK